MVEKEIVSCELKELGEIEIRLVSQSLQEEEWNYLVKKYHYLSHKKVIGKRLKYLIYGRGEVIGAMGWKSGYIKLAARDKCLGWEKEELKKNLNYIINNNRFLILDWIRVKNLASYILGQNMRQVIEDWTVRYKEKPQILETYVDSRFKGTCYRASNWQFVGKTKGFTKEGKSYRYHGNRKDVYIYVLDKKLRSRLNIDTSFSREPSKNKEKKERIDMMIQKVDYNPELISWADINSEMIEEMGKELVSFHDEFRDVFIREEQYHLGQIYLKGLLSDIERKNVEAIALRYLGKERVRSLQKFMKDYKWANDTMLGKIQKQVSVTLGKDDGMVTVDSSENRKKGNNSVGVSRQYCGNIGKVENCQSGVFIGYTSTQGYALIDKQLYMPEKWFSQDYEERRKECLVPDELTFKTKLEIALEKIREIKAEKSMPFKWIGADATFGSSSYFRDEAAKLGIYFVSVKSNAPVWLQMPELETYTGHDKKGNPVQKQRLAPEAQKSIKVSDIDISRWETVKLQEGSKGPLYAKVCMMRVIESRGGLPGNELWLFVRRDPDGTIKYFFSNAPRDIDFEEMQHACIMRYPIEQCFKDGKKYLGMDHYETRSWPAWHRHMTYVFLALLFLLQLRLKFKKKFLH